jgi:hypothetical protein
MRSIAYIHTPLDSSAIEVNAKLLDTTLHALKETSPRIQHFVFQTGAKVASRICALDELLNQAYPPVLWASPLRDNSYTSWPVQRKHAAYSRAACLRHGHFLLQTTRCEFACALIITFSANSRHQVITAHAQSVPWTWTDLRPDVVVGYAPTINPMNLALALGVYLALFRAVHGKGARVPLPASISGASALNTESPAEHLARGALWFSLHPDSEGKTSDERSFNVGAQASTYAERWPALAAAWGLEGVPTRQEDTAMTRAGADVTKWAAEHKDTWRALEQEHGLRPGVLEATQFDFFFVMNVPLDRQLDLSKVKSAGFMEEADAAAAYEEAWKKFAQAKVLPPL